MHPTPRSRRTLFAAIVPTTGALAFAMSVWVRPREGVAQRASPPPMRDAQTDSVLDATVEATVDATAHGPADATADARLAISVAARNAALDHARECLRTRAPHCAVTATDSISFAPRPLCLHAFRSMARPDVGVPESEQLRLCCLAHFADAPELCERLLQRRLDRFRHEWLDPAPDRIVPDRNRRIDRTGGLFVRRGRSV